MTTVPNHRTLVGTVMRSRVVSIGPDATLADAARALRSANVGLLAVVDHLGQGGDEAVSGVLSERDVVEALALGSDVAATPVSAAMSAEPRYVTAEDHVVTAVEAMLDAGVRHLPVLDDGQLVGIISMRDLLRLAMEESRPPVGSARSAA